MWLLYANCNWSSKPCSKLFYWLHIIAILQQDLRMRCVVVVCRCLGNISHATDCSLPLHRPVPFCCRPRCRSRVGGIGFSKFSGALLRLMKIIMAMGRRTRAAVFEFCVWNQSHCFCCTFPPSFPEINAVTYWALV